jgi:hypothetical protein
MTALGAAIKNKQDHYNVDILQLKGRTSKEKLLKISITSNNKAPYTMLTNLRHDPNLTAGNITKSLKWYFKSAIKNPNPVKTWHKQTYQLRNNIPAGASVYISGFKAKINETNRRLVTYYGPNGTKNMLTMVKNDAIIMRAKILNQKYKNSVVRKNASTSKL